MTATAEMKLKTLVPWFGGKRTLAPEIVLQLGPHAYYFEGCFGGLSVLFAKEPSSHECICDLHGGVTNLAWVVQDEDWAVRLYNRLQRVMYSDEVYAASKAWLESFDENETIDSAGKLDFAFHYFIASWMGRNGVAGTARTNYQIATRWTKGGGSGPLRFRNAVDSIPPWCDRLRNAQILRRDLFDLLPKIEDDEQVAIYVDPPYFHGTIGQSRYIHDFQQADDATEAVGLFATDVADPLVKRFGDHGRLALALRRFRKARVVVSYYADPQLHTLYPGWTFLDCSRHKHLHVQNGRGSTRTEAPEVLIVNGEALA